MKKSLTITFIFILAISFMAAGSTRAEAMNNESAALLTAGIVLLGIPVMQAMARDRGHHEQTYVYATPPPRHVERTTVIYVQPQDERRHKHWRKSYKRGYRDDNRRHEYYRGGHDAHEDSRGHRGYN